jgi:primosomal protein N' (replication factor Y) (superfamily II helicase)
VTLVGILNADNHLQVPDFRASEQVFQMITQVAGRSGRGRLPGEVIIQTRMPDHPVIQLASTQNYEAFFEQELQLRELFQYPPLQRLIKIVITDEDVNACLSFATQIRQQLISLASSHVEFLPVVPCGHARIKNKHRFQFIIKGKSLQSLLPTLAKLKAETPRALHLLIDVDPLSTFF